MLIVIIVKYIKAILMKNYDISNKVSYKKNLFVIINKKGSLRNLGINKHVFTLNEHVLSNKEKKGLKHVYPSSQRTSIESEILISKTNNIKVEFKKIIKDIKLFNNFKDLEELIEPLLEIKISRFLYLKSVIPVYEKYTLINNSKNKTFNSKLDLILEIEKIYVNHKKADSEFFNIFTVFNFNFYSGFLLKLQTVFLKRIINNNQDNITFFSDRKAYFINFLKLKIQNKKKLTIYYSNSRSYPRIIK